jgi:hypothetical protein
MVDSGPAWAPHTLDVAGGRFPLERCSMNGTNASGLRGSGELEFFD